MTDADADPQCSCLPVKIDPGGGCDSKVAAREIIGVSGASLKSSIGDVGVAGSAIRASSCGDAGRRTRC